MVDACANPYCDDADAEVREPTAEELESFLSELDEECRRRVIEEQITLVICTSCGVSKAAKWDSKKEKTVRQVVPSPCKYAVGEQVSNPFRRTLWQNGENTTTGQDGEDDHAPPACREFLLDRVRGRGKGVWLFRKESGTGSIKHVSVNSCPPHFSRAL